MREKQPQSVSKYSKGEQVLIGTWNALRPESQGKAILNVYDRYFTPKYTTKKEEEKAKKMRPIVEKVVGWTAFGLEAGLITLGVVKGYRMIKRKGVDRVQGVPSLEKSLLVNEKSFEALGMIDKRNVAGAIEQAVSLFLTNGKGVEAIPDELMADLSLNRIDISQEMKEIALREFVEGVYTRVVRNPTLVAEINNCHSRFGQDNFLFGEAKEFKVFWLEHLMKGAAILDGFDGKSIPKTNSIAERITQVSRFIPILQLWLPHMNWPGVDKIGVLLKPRRVRKVAGL